jgi:hypothetical protein
MLRLLISRKQARGVSILEVLFAILICAIGLMGAIAVFPAAMSQARRGQQADDTAIAGLKCLHDFDALGMRQPSHWLYFEASPPSGGAQYFPVTSPYLVGPPPQYRCFPNGRYAYCIDPRFIAAQAFATNPQKTDANYFPYGATGSAMLRVTLQNNLPVGHTNRAPMSSLIADLHFGIPDDIAYDRFRDGVVVRDNTLQAASKFVVDSSNNALKREDEGHMSWMATLAPKLERLASGATFEDRYILSTVVFYDRPNELLADGTYPASEWVVDITLDGGGINGGEVTLSSTNSLDEVNVRNGQWIMLMAQTLEASTGHIMPMCRWYRVVDSDDPVQAGANYTSTVSLAGPDFTDNYASNPGIKAIICKGVAAVYEKTIKLDSQP